MGAWECSPVLFWFRCGHSRPFGAWRMSLSENRYPPRIKCGAGFFRDMRSSDRLCLLRLWLQLGLHPITGVHAACLPTRGLRLRPKRRASHPRLRLNMLQPILDRRNPAEIVGHVLLADRSHRNLLAVAVLERRAKNGRAQEDAFAVMPQRAMPE